MKDHQHHHQHHQPKTSKQKERILESTVKTFEDAAFEMLSTVSPIKLPRDEIPFDSVREIVLGEILKEKQQKAAAAAAAGTSTTRNSGGGRRRNMDDLLEEGPSSSSSSGHIPLNDVESASSSGALERGTMTDEPEMTPRPIAARLYGDGTRSSSTSSASAPCFQSENATETKKKAMNYREKRLADVRQGRLKKYRENAELVEFKCEENVLAETFCKYYGELMDEEPTAVCAVTIYFRIVESLDVFFRAKTWESNCPKLLCEFLCDNILKTCQELNDAHDSKNSSDVRKAKECQVQVLLTLHVFVVTDERRFLDEAVHKLRMIYISAGAEQLKLFVEGPVTDVYWELIGDGLATIYDELCINLPPDLQQYDNGLFKMTEPDETPMVVKRRNGHATRLEQMLIETSAEFGVGGVERCGGRIPPAVALAMEAPIVKRSLKRKAEEPPKALLSPTRPTRSTGSARGDYKQFFVEDTPDEKYAKRVIKKEPPASDEDDDDEEYDGEPVRLSRIAEQIEEEVKQTPMAKLRMAANKNGHRCSKRLSDLVKLSEERAQVPRKARENLDKFLEKAKGSTPLRAVGRQTRKSVLFGATTPTSSPMSTRASCTSLLPKFTEVEQKKKNDGEESDSGDERGEKDSDYEDVKSKEEEETEDEEEEEEGEEEEEEAPVVVPTIRQRTTRRGAPPARYRDAFADRQKAVRVKEEVEDVEFDAIEATSSSALQQQQHQQPCSSTSSGPPSSAGGSSAVVKNGKKWTDRQLKRQLGLTRDDLNRYQDAMQTTGERRKINWESAQMNRAGRIKGDEAKIFGIPRRKSRTMICHGLLNDTNPDTSFNWNKVKFDDMRDKPRTRSMQSLMQKPEQYMETLKNKYIASKSPAKKTRSMENLPSAAGPSFSASSSSSNLPSTSTTPSKKRTSAAVTRKKRSSGASRGRPSLQEPTATSTSSSAPGPSTSSSASTSSASKKKSYASDFGIESEADD